MFIVTLIITVGITLWVYLDAKAIGAKKDLGPGVIGNDPGTWALVVFFLLIIGLPLYLFKRDAIKELTGNKGIGFSQSLAILIPTVFLAFICYSIVAPQ